MLLKNVFLRQAGQADWPAIQALLQANQLPLDGAEAHLSTFVVAASGSEIVGVAGAEVYGSVALLRSVAIAPGLHRQGIGDALVRLLLQEAARRGVRRVFLLTTTAADYFTRYGFAVANKAQAPQALQGSAEFQGACPDSATFMGVTLFDEPKIDRQLPVAVLGAGPVGLAAVAQLIERGIQFVVLEAGASVGTSLQQFGHVRLFSPWRYNIDPAMSRLLKATGWQAPPDEGLPLAREVAQRVLQPFAQLPAVRPHLMLNTRVVSISREGFDKVKSAGREKAAFVIRAQRDGVPIEIKASAVIDATGTWSTQNPIGANGLPADGEHQHADRIFYGIPDVLGRDRQRYAGRRTLVVGAGHSAANALLDLAQLAREEPGTKLAWSVRTGTPSRVFGGGAADALPARGQLGSDLRRLRDRGGLEFHGGLRIAALRSGSDGRLLVEGIGPDGQPRQIADVDEIVCATGQRPDLSLASELRLKLDPWLESVEALGPLIDPNLHSCGTVRPHGHRELAHPEPGFYTLGVKSYGRAPTFLMATGFEQARSVVAAIDGDFDAADQVELDLPETGVCGVGVPASAVDAEAAGGCCGGPPKSDAEACCVLDEEKKAAGESGCGCSSPATEAATKPAAAAVERRTSCCPPATAAAAGPAAPKTRCCG